jgi:hypothetical protein
MSIKLFFFLTLSGITLALAACNIGVDPSLIPSQEEQTSTSTSGVTETISPTSTKPVNTPEIWTTTPEMPPEICQLGMGLRQQTIPVVMDYQDFPGFVMTATVGLAGEYYPGLEDWTRTIGAPSLEALENKAQRAEQQDIPYDALSYGLETSESTPDEEWQDIVAATKAARAISDQYGKLLVMGPGFRLMSQNEDQYPVLSGLADIWMLQTQRLQVDPPGEAYRDEVERVVKLIRSGNPDIPIWAQITFPPDRDPDYAEWIAYHKSISDLVKGTYIGIYTWETVDNEILVMNADRIYHQLCLGDG